MLDERRPGALGRGLETARTPKDTWRWWLVIVAVLWPLDIALRRLSS